MDVIPTIPRLPFIGDPLMRRVRVPKDLEAITTVGEEAPPEAGGVERTNVEAMWGAARDWFRSGVHPAMQVCVRRNGEVILDRAIGHAARQRPARPRRRRDGSRRRPRRRSASTRRRRRSPRSSSTRWPRRACSPSTTRSPSYIPGYEANGKGKITIGHVLAHRAGVPNLPPRGARPRLHRRPRPPPRGALRGQADPQRRPGPGLPRGRRRLHPRRGRLRRHRQGHPRGAGRGVPRAARLPLDELRRRAGRRRRGGRQLHHRPAHRAAALDHPDPGPRPPARRPRRA